MNYTKYDMNGYRLHIIQTEKFKTVRVQMFLK